MEAGTGDEENFCLRWNDYEKKYAELFRTLREDDHFADVTLACEGHSVKAHRIILCACSSYFQNILKSINPVQHPVLLLSDVRFTDMTALMDFIYFGQVNIAQDSLQSFLKVADKLKIKGLCEQGTLLHEIPQTIPRDDKKTSNGLIHENLDFLSTIYLSEPQVSSAQTRHNTTIISAPPAHQSPKNTLSRVATRPGESTYMMLVPSPKKAKYSAGTRTHPSILRNQLINKELAGSSVEVKSEPLLINPAHTQEDVPSRAPVSVTEYITTELPQQMLDGECHGMPSQFTFTSDPSGDPGSVAPAPATHVTVPEKDAITSVSESGYSTRMVSLSVNNHGNQIDHNQIPSRPEDPEPKDLTPIEDVNNAAIGQGVIAGMSSNTETPMKKSRGVKRTCPYCGKSFHEMSLKRHIKDVHFRTAESSVVCPVCCKNYASRNSLYSHLNRVHYMKREDLGTYRDPLRNQSSTDSNNMSVRPGNQQGDSNPEGIMDLAQHSDHSN